MDLLQKKQLLKEIIPVSTDILANLRSFRDFKYNRKDIGGSMPIKEVEFLPELVRQFRAGEVLAFNSLHTHYEPSFFSDKSMKDKHPVCSRVETNFFSSVRANQGIIGDFPVLLLDSPEEDFIFQSSLEEFVSTYAERCFLARVFMKEVGLPNGIILEGPYKEYIVKSIHFYQNHKSFMVLGLMRKFRQSLAEAYHRSDLDGGSYSFLVLENNILEKKPQKIVISSTIYSPTAS